jgi:hypothetical protein
MKKWWIGAGLLAAWTATAGLVHAQAYLTTPFGAARYPDPIPCGDSNVNPPLTPGPLTPLQAPPGPGPDLGLNPNVSNAYPCGDPIAPDVGVYFHAGALGLEPNRLGYQPVAVVTTDVLKDGTPGSPGAPTIVDSHQVPMNFMWGAQTTLGLQDENRSFNSMTALPGQLDAQFENAPFGFSGDNGIFTHDDRIFLNWSNKVGDGEINYRYSDRGTTSIELILGIRTMYTDNTYQIAVGQDDLTFPLKNGMPDPTRQAIYTVETKVIYTGPQIGGELEQIVLPWLSAGFNGKASLGSAYAEYRNALVRGDGFVGFDRTARDFTFMQVYEFEAFLEMHLAERVKIRAGYKCLWMLNNSNAQDQVDFNLANPNPIEKSTGSSFYAGPTLEMGFYF